MSAQAIAAPVQGPVQVPVRMVQVHIDPSTVLSYEKPIKFATPMSNAYGNLSVVNPLPCMIEEGTRILVGNNNYVLVSEFVDTVDTIPHQPAKREMEQELGVGTIIEQDNGIAVAIATSIVVKIPEYCKIRLAAGTRLQQVDVPIRLTLDTEVKAIIIPA